ncbi:MAG TPA: hypothetical protein VGJ16_03350 [Pirellulales bacterium]|jgi:hypothetical protein
MKQAQDMTSEQLVKALHEALGQKLRAVVLYGSAAAGDFVPGVSGRDILIVAEPIGAVELAELAGPLRRWEQAGNPLPQIFTPRELRESADVFPIEIWDMQQARQVLFGTDPLADVRIDMQHYRLQLERELKTRLLQLRRRYVAAAGNSDRIARLMAASVSTVLVLLRAALRLYNDAAPKEKADALEQLAQHVKFDPQPLREALALKQRKTPPAAAQVENSFGRYLSSIEEVIESVDRHLHGPSPPPKN